MKTSGKLSGKNVSVSGHEMLILTWGQGSEYFALEYIQLTITLY